MRRPKLLAMREEQYLKIVRDNEKLARTSSVAMLLSIINFILIILLLIIKL